MKMKREKNVSVYTEPTEYFPKELRKKYKLGEYAEEKPKATPTKKKK